MQFFMLWWTSITKLCLLPLGCNCATVMIVMWTSDRQDIWLATPKGSRLTDWEPTLAWQERRWQWLGKGWRNKAWEYRKTRDAWATLVGFETALKKELSLRRHHTYYILLCDYKAVTLNTRLHSFRDTQWKQHNKKNFKTVRILLGFGHSVEILVIIRNMKMFEYLWEDEQCKKSTPWSRLGSARMLKFTFERNSIWRLLFWWCLKL